MTAETRIPTSRATILAAGFKGLLTIETIHGDEKYGVIPEVPGIYGVFRLADPPPRFISNNAAARWKGQDPTIGVPALQAAWVDAALLYVDKGASIRTRVRQLVEFGHGKVVAHWGGRALWQLTDMDDLVVAWKPTEDPKGAEAELLAAFEAAHGTKPWANALDKA